MDELKNLTDCELAALPILSLAYLGDAVFEEMVREHLVRSGGCHPAILNRKALDFVTAASQSGAVDALLEHLTEHETDVFRRGRNAKSKATSAKKHTPQYLKATGMECVFGYLKLTGQIQRMRELFYIIVQSKV